MKQSKLFTLKIGSTKLEFELILHESGTWEIHVGGLMTEKVAHGFVQNNHFQWSHSHQMVKLFDLELMAIVKKELPKLQKRFNHV